MYRKLLTAVFAVCLVGIGVRAHAQASTGYVYMTASGNADAVTIDIDITDGGEGPAGCDWFGVQRGENGGDIIQVITRQPGTTTHYQVVDTGLQPNTIYCYVLVLLQYPIPVPLYCGGDQSSICWAVN